MLVSSVELFGKVYEVGSLYKFIAQLSHLGDGTEDYTSFDYVNAFDVTRFQDNLEEAHRYIPDIRHKNFYPLPKGSNILLVSLRKDRHWVTGVFLYDEHFLLLELRNARGCLRSRLANVDG